MGLLTDIVIEKPTINTLIYLNILFNFIILNDNTYIQ